MPNLKTTKSYLSLNYPKKSANRKNKKKITPGSVSANSTLRGEDLEAIDGQTPKLDDDGNHKS